MQLTVKDLTEILTNNPEAVVSVAVINGVEIRIMPATQIQLMVNRINGKEVKNLLIIHNEEQSK